MGYDGAMKQTKYKIEATWDADSKVWVAEGINFVGLCTEAPTMEKLIKKLDVMVPELLRENEGLRSRKLVPFEVTSTVHSVARLH